MIKEIAKKIKWIKNRKFQQGKGIYTKESNWHSTNNKCNI